MTPDTINAAFEIGAGGFILLHVRATWRARSADGVSLVAMVFFFAWGLWNLFYYPHLGQSLSFYGGIFVLLTNAAWVASVYHFKHGKGLSHH